MVLFFSVNKSGRFQGYALMTSAIGADNDVTSSSSLDKDESLWHDSRAVKGGKKPAAWGITLSMFVWYL